MAVKLLSAVAAGLLATAAATASISVNTTSVDNLGWVRVSFKGLTATEAKDAWIGLYSPANASVAKISALPYPATAPWTAAAPVKFITLADMNNGANVTGQGYWDFEVINMYEDAVFWLFTEGITSPYYEVKTDVITFNTQPPLRGHLTPTGNSDEMTVTWNTATKGSGNMVQYGSAPGTYTYQAAAVSTTYTKDDLCGAPANSQGWFTPHYWQSATMTGITPGQTVYYRYGSASGGWSDEYSFTALPTANAQTPIKLLAYADMGMAELDGSTDHWANPEAYETVANMINAASNGDYALGLHVGDVSYATGNEAKWYLFDERNALLARNVPIAYGHGNHERDFPGTGTSSYYATSVDSGGECGIATVTRYPTPAAPNGAAPLNSTWYSIATGPVTVIMLNSELPMEPTSPQYAYLQSTLQGIDRTVTPWVIVAFHRPLYYGGVTRDANFAQIEGLLYQYQVDLVLNGHVHYAQVYCAMYQSKCVTPSAPGEYDAPVYAIIGNAGMDLTPIGPTSDTLLYQASEYGYSTIHIDSPTSLSMFFYADSTNDMHYNFTITRNFPRAPIEARL